MRKILFFLFLLIPATAYATPLKLDSPSVILVEQTTGRVLYSRNERERHPPADLTKMLTALLAVEYLKLDDEIIIGQEIRGMPAGFASNVHTDGEVITVEKLLHALLIRSANESGRVLALNVVRQRDNRRNIPYSQAETTFAVMLNEKARELGTSGTHFNNPFGFTSENHFTTAHDLAIITRAFMDEPILAEIAQKRVFEDWTNANQLLPDAPHGHPYVIGAMAGSSTAAGNILAGAAYNDGLQLVTVVLGGTDAARWQDTRRLMDYGFNNFRFREIARANEVLQTVLLENPRLGSCDTMEIIIGESYTALLSHAEYAALTRTITLDELILTESESGRVLHFAPIKEYEPIGRVTYTVNDTVILEVPVLSGTKVYERTFDSDMDYYFAAFFGSIFTRRALPYWFGIFGVAFGIFGIYIAIKTSRRAGRNAGWVYGNQRKSKYNRYN